jgi:hypothetical protein
MGLSPTGYYTVFRNIFINEYEFGKKENIHCTAALLIICRVYYAFKCPISS